VTEASVQNGREKRSVKISIFNHKGGVGKTTLTVNVAAALASMGKRILLVDSDPQCNLTAYLVEEDVVDDLLDHSDSPDGKTVWSAVKPVSDAIGDVRFVSPLERAPNTFLLPGDIRLSEFEQELSTLWSDCYQRKPKGFNGTTALSRLVEHVSVQNAIDFVFYDAGPNIGPLNRVVMLDCDYFIVPVACDLFSIRALKTLGFTLSKWINDWARISELAPVNTPILSAFPRFLGYVPQRFRVYGGDVARSYAKYLPQIERHIESDLVSVLRDVDVRLVETSGGRELGQVKDFATIAAASQSAGRPMKDVDAGNAIQREDAAQTFLDIARNIVARTTDEIV
jgi:cellulose biosynthesis protein BcsQ